MAIMYAADIQARQGYRGSGGSPIGIGGAVAVHALVAAVFILMPKEAIAPYVPPIFIGNQIPLDPPPPPEPVPPTQEAKIPTRTVSDPQSATYADTIVPPVSGEGIATGDGKTGQGAGGGLPLTVDPPHEPMLVEASIDPRSLSAFQPDYPGSMIRQGMEGSVTVRVTIGPDGRVLGIERLSATDDAFWIATQRHALRKWRFRPATRDGVAVGSNKVLTVHFRLTDR